MIRAQGFTRCRRDALCSWPPRTPSSRCAICLLFSSRSILTPFSSGEFAGDSRERGQFANDGDHTDARAVRLSLLFAGCFAFNFTHALLIRLVKISTSLYDTLMPLVKDQVSAQIKVCDLSRMTVEVQPADYPSWAAASDFLAREAVSGFRAQHRRALVKANGNVKEIASINAEFAEKIEEEQLAVANTPLEFFAELKTEYNFL